MAACLTAQVDGHQGQLAISDSLVHGDLVQQSSISVAKVGGW